MIEEIVNNRENTSLIKFIKPDFEFGDNRGRLTQLVSNGWQQVNFITSLANNIRGGHYHKYNREAFYIIDGKFKLSLIKEQQTVDFIMGRGDFFIVEPYVKHVFEYIEDTNLISLYDKGVELSDGTKDIFI